MLTKEEYRKMLENSRYLEVVVRNENGEVEFYTNFENTDIFFELKQLINEHFDNNNARTVQNLVSEIDKLEKALDKACLILENIDNRCAYFEKEYYKAIGKEVSEELEVNTKEEWIEVLMKDD